MTLRRTWRIAHTCWIAGGALLLAGCSFIDDWGSLRRQPADGVDSGMLDGGRDGGRDGGMHDACPQECACPSDQACIELDGCFQCAPCPPCIGCGTQCVAIDLDQDICYCEGGRGAGEACLVDAECQSGLTCPAGVCSSGSIALEGWRCPPDGECATGLECVSDVCVRRCSTSSECDAVFPACHDGVCGAATGGEWQPCNPSGTCDTGLDCHDAGGTGFLMCVRPCTNNAQCVGAEHPQCGDFDLDGQLECTPPGDCDFVYGTGCDPDRVCGIILVGMPEAAGYCVFPQGVSAEPGQPCGPGIGCGAGAACFGDGVTNVCRAFCYTDEGGCPSGQSCNNTGIPFNGREIGVCG